MVRLNDGTIKNGVSYLKRTDRNLGGFFPQVPFLTYKKRSLNFATFINVVVNQQLSDKASDTIRRRIYALLNDQVTPTRFLETKVVDLRKCGISNQKIQHLRSIATVIQSDPKYFSRLRRHEAEECCKQLLALKGIGPWSTSIIALFYIGHPDVLVEGDVTINKVLSRLYDVEIDEVPKTIQQMTQHWRPYRSVGCLSCYHLFDNKLI